MEARYAKDVREALARHGLGAEVDGTLEMWASPDGAGGPDRGNIAIGYTHDGKRRETAMASLPSVDDALELLDDKERLGALMSLGIGAMPRAHRPVVPHWITENETARRTRRDLARAGRLADDACEGRTVDQNTGTSDPDSPF